MKSFVLLGVSLIGLLPGIMGQPTQNQFHCPPCNLDCDTLTFSEPGTCPHCPMTLIPTKVYDPLETPKLQPGSGVFFLPGGKGQPENVLSVYYHLPASFSETSPILIVIPGAGRNGDSYRDAWVKAAEKYGVLILSPMYPEQTYDFAAYHMGGVIEQLNIRQVVSPIAGTNQVQLTEETLSFTLQTDREQWIFSDFDRIFATVIRTLNSQQTHYDIFGHSAGGQILHRLALFYPQSKADRIIAANSGFYTLPNLNASLPFGIKETPISQASLTQSFQKKLVLMVGELDNAEETGGTLLRSPSADQQGLHRLSRGHYFFEFAKGVAKEMNGPFNWEKEIVPGVGHNQRKMAEHAAKYLYGK